MSSIKIIAAEEIIRDQRVMKEATYLSENGFNVEILCWDRENEFFNREVEYVGKVKIKRFFPRSEYGSGWKQLISFLKFICLLKRYLKNVHYDYLHCQNLDGVIIGRLVNFKKKIIFDMRELYLGRERNKIKKWILSVLLNYAIQTSWKIIHVNETQIKEMSEEEKLKLIYLPNYPQKSLGERIKKTEDSSLRIGYIGGVRQYDIFINLFEATKEFKDVKINIHGGGTSFTKLKMVEQDYPQVTLTGRYDPKDTDKLFSTCDVLYCVYAMENLNWKTAYPIKFYEAIITKTPVIVSKGSVLEDFLMKHDIGFVVDGSNTDEVRELVQYINDNKSILRDKVKKLENIQYDYSWESVVKNLKHIY